MGQSAAWILPSRGQKLFSCTPSSPLHPELKMSASKDFRGLLLNERSATTTPPPCIGAPATFTSEPSKKFKFDIQAKCLFRTLHWPPAYLNHGLVKAAAQLWQGRWRWRFFASIFRHFPTHHHLLALLPSFSSCTAWFIVDGVHMVEHGPRANLNHSSFNSTHGTTLPDKNGKWHRKNAQTFRNKVKAWKWQGCKQEQSRCGGRDCIRYDGNYSELRRYQLPSHHPSKSLPSSKRKQTQLYQKEGISC